VSVDLSFPTWAKEYIVAWSKRLYLDQWTLRMELALTVCNHEDTRASCYAQADVNTATLTFRADIEDTEAWRRTILHELMHVVHARIDHCVTRAIVPQAAEASQPLADVIYKQQMESFIDGMADSLYWCTRYRDYPAEYPGDAP